MSHPFKKRAVCRNDHILGEVQFGDLFHYHAEVCPTCGDPKSHWRVLTIRLCESRHWEDAKGARVGRCP